jgi:diguanylate cyclase (GGDEF)-like protein
MCVGECGRGGYTVRDDTPLVQALLRSRRPVVALLATEYAAALSPMTFVQVDRALEMLGFCAVETTVLGEEIVAEGYELLHGRDCMLLSIRSTCPVAVDFVRTFHPGLVPALAPIVPPYIAQARLIRALYTADVAIVYVSPCYARKDEVYDPQFAGAVDVAIDFLELKRLIAADETDPSHGRTVRPSVRRPGVLKEVSLTDGFPRNTVVSRHMTDAGVHTVRGLADLERLLKAIEAGETGPVVIDMLNCEGCIDGPAVAPGLSLYAKRSVDAAARQDQSTTRVSTRALLGVLPAIDIVRSFSPAPVHLPRPGETDIDEVLAAGGFTRETAPDCGACGWPTCVEHATAIFRGDSTWDLCLPLQRALLREQSTLLKASETLDPLTGLWNRRSFKDRLDLECARYARYGSALSVLLVDADGFGAVNDRYGEAAGDLALAELGARIGSLIRSTDLVARWVGDQFAIIVPGIGKTAAFAVAEKLRQAVAESPVAVTTDGYTHEVDVTVSIGVASARGAATEPGYLLEAADAALRGAIMTGGDQARLAPG